MLTVHLRINDAATKKAMPARVRISADDGTHFVPLGRSTEFPIGRNEAVGGVVKIDGGERWFYTSGSCEIPLPAGVPLRVQITKGPEYRSLEQTVTLGAGQMALRFTLERWIDSHADGWVSVDTRCHFLTPHDALLEAEAEGLDVVNLLATAQRFPSFDGIAYQTVPNLTAFSGQSPALVREGVSVVVNTLNTHPVLGKVALLNSHRPVFPLTFGGEETDDWGVCDWCDQCHRKGGLSVWVDAFEPASGLVGGESLIAALLGKIDAIEVNGASRKVPLMPWVYRLWNAGVLVPLVGASGKESNRVALGSVRAYAKVQEPNPPTPFPEKEGGESKSPSPSGGGAASKASGVGSWAWVEAVRAGRMFATTGPLIDFKIAGTEIVASARSLVPFLELEIVSNGHVIANAAATENRAEVRGSLPAAGWVAVRCRSAAGDFAHSSPLAVGVSGRDPEAVAALLKLVEQTREWGELHGRYANPKRREQFMARCVEALAKLRADA